MFPAAPQSQSSACCFPEDTCLSNRLCLNAAMMTSRGSCTDPTWQGEGCAPWCQDVLPHGGSRIVNVKDGLFCCGLGYFNSTNGTCYNSTRGSDAPFSVDQGHVIFNRSSGSTSPNETTTIMSTVTLAASTIRSVITTAAATTRTAASSPPTSDRETMVGVAVGVPLGIALFAVGGMLWGQKRKADGLVKEKKGWEEKYITLLESIRETLRREDVARLLSESPLRYQLEDITMGEMAG